MSHPFASYRKLFPILESAVQLSSCSQSALSLPVRNAALDYLKSWETRGADWGYWMERVEAARAGFARLINATPGDVAQLSCVSDAASAVASALQFSPGRNRIITTTLDFPSVCHVWLAQERRGAQVKFVNAIPGNTEAGQLVALHVDGQTALVSVSHACFYDGQLTDITVTGDAARRVGALQFVDAYQSAGAIDIDVQAQRVDLLATGMQKYLLGTPGVTFLYVAPALAARLEPTVTGWFGRTEPFAFDPRKLDFAAGAQRFNTGTPPMLAASMAEAALGLLNEIGVQPIEAWLRRLSEVALEEAGRLGLTVVSPTDVDAKGPTTAIRVRDAGAVERSMAREGFVVSARNDVIRVAPHFYNTEDDVVRALRTLARLMHT